MILTILLSIAIGLVAWGIAYIIKPSRPYAWVVGVVVGALYFLVSFGKLS